jgi:hypothetical protein
LNSRSNLTRTGAAFLLLSLAACGGSSDVTPVTPPPAGAPSVISSAPANDANGVLSGAAISATFNEAMNDATFTTATFTLTFGSPAVLVPGRVIYTATGWKVVFVPSAQLAGNTSYTATVTTGVKSSTDVALAAARSWSFTTAAVMAAGPVDLGTAGNYAILAKSAISTVPASVITGNLGLSPAAASYITGFSLVPIATNVSSTSTQVVGDVYAADYAVPTSSNLTTAIGDMELAYTVAAGLPPGLGFTEESSGNIGGTSLAPGVHKWGTGVSIATDLTLSGSATDVWVFQIAQGLDLADGVQVTLAGGALPQNIFWQVAGAVTVNTTAHLEGIVLSKTAIAMLTGSSINGRLLAQTAVTLDATTVTQP